MARYAQNFIDMQPRNSAPNMANDVRRALHVLLPRGRSNIEQVSQSLGLSTRTLQRQLAATGDNFQASTKMGMLRMVPSVNSSSAPWLIRMPSNLSKQEKFNHQGKKSEEMKQNSASGCKHTQRY